MLARNIARWTGTAFLCIVGTARAAVVSYSDAIAAANLPSTLTEGAWESSSNLYLFAEGQNVALAEPLAVDVMHSGTYDDFRLPALLPYGGSIAAGTIVDSFLLHFAPLGQPKKSEGVTLNASITFAGEILGLLLRNPTLVAADSAFGHFAAYPDSGQRGPDRAEDVITLSADRRTLTVSLSEWNDLDQFRIVTMAVPEPATWTLAALGFIIVLRSGLRGRSARGLSSQERGDARER